MATNRDMNLNTSENAPSCTANMVKTAFSAWLLREKGNQYSVNTVIASLDIASEQLQKRKIAAATVWELTKPAAFAVVYNNARNHKLFRIMDKNNYSAFMRDGQLYFKFLKSKPLFHSINDMPESSSALNKKVEDNLTIKEAVIRVLSERKKAMTAEEIYNEIVEKALYSFGAQNPINVVRNIIHSACDNSNYSEKYRDASPRFHFERNSEGGMPPNPCTSFKVSLDMLN